MTVDGRRGDRPGARRADGQGRRGALQVLTAADAVETDKVLGELMGKDVEARYKFITERAAQADLDL